MAPGAPSGKLLLISATRGAGRPASFWRFEGSPPPGAGKAPVLAIAGLGLDGRAFSRLGALAADRDLVLANIPNDIPPAARMEDLARETLSALDAAGHAGRPPVLLGSSFGGMVAMAAALAAPERTAALVLVGTAPGWSFVPLRLRTAAAFQGLLPRRPFPRLFAAFMLPPFKRFEPSIREELRTQMLHRTKESVAATLGAMRGFEALGRLGAVRAPALVIHGGEDGVLPPRGGAAVAAALPRARLEVIPGAGHLPQMSHPGAVASLVSGFLSREGV